MARRAKTADNSPTSAALFAEGRSQFGRAPRCLENHRHAEEGEGGMERRETLVLSHSPAGEMALDIGVSLWDA